MIETSKSAREILKKLEASGEYVFHGSGDLEMNLFEPQQAYNYKSGEKEKDGDPAVFTSSSVDYAIMMALVNKKNCPNGFHLSMGAVRNKNGENELSIQATKHTLDQLSEQSTGAIYVFNKNIFTQRGPNSFEYLSVSPATPAQKIKITALDLPNNIEIVTE